MLGTRTIDSLAAVSGALHQARACGVETVEPVDVVYVIPKEGAPLWTDMVAIPSDAPHPQNA